VVRRVTWNDTLTLLFFADSFVETKVKVLESAEVEVLYNFRVHP
jgi:hypothetical protein